VVAGSENAERERRLRPSLLFLKSMRHRSQRKCIAISKLTLSTQSLAFAAWWACVMAIVLVLYPKLPMYRTECVVMCLILVIDASG